LNVAIELEENYNLRVSRYSW